MKSNRLRLFLSIFLFLSWIGYLGLLVASTTRGQDGKPIRLSQPQFLTSSLDLVVTIDPLGNNVVSEVLYSNFNEKTPKVGNPVLIENLDFSEIKNTEFKSWLVPLISKDRGKTFEIASLPPSPGFSGGTTKIYPALTGVLEQYKKIAKP